MFTTEGVKTRIFKLDEPVLDFIIEVFQARSSPGTLKENDVLCITSKIVSLSESRIIPRHAIGKRDLIKKEADIYLADGPFDVSLTIKHGLMIPSAGIDESNADGDFYILYPTDPFASARKICDGLKARLGIKNLGVILTDSHTQPLRRGVSGIALSYWGFEGVKNYAGKPDLFGRSLKYTSVHAADALATAAVFEMGESSEAKCLAVIRGANISFCDKIDPREGLIAPENDLYFSLYKSQIKQ